MKKGGLLGLDLIVLFFSLLPLADAKLVINEFLPNSVNTDYEWIELYNDDTLSVNISQYNISEEAASKNFTIKDIILEPKSFIVLVRSDEIFNKTYATAGVKIIEYGDVVASLNLNDGGDSIFLYDSNGQLTDSIKDYANPGENVSIGRYPDGASEVTNLMEQTPGAKNDNSKPAVEWVHPNNNTYVNYLVNIVVKITDDTATIEYAMVDFNGTNNSMSSNNNQWSYLWNTSLNLPKFYNITVFFKDSYNKYYSDTIYNIAVNNTEAISKFNKVPVITLINLTNADYLNRANGSLRVSWVYSDEDNDAITDEEILWYVDGNENPALRNFTSIAPANLRKNQAWTASARIFDGKNWSILYNSSILTVSNSAPVQSLPIIESSDDKSRKSGTLSCSSEVTDYDNDDVVIFIRWYKNNVLSSATGSSTLKSGNYSKDDSVICEITPSDGSLNGTPLNSTNFRILNSAPVLVSSIPDKAWSIDTSAVINLIDAFMDLDGDGLTYTYKPVPNITVEMDNSKKIATLIPDKGFSGTRSIVFTASDGTDSTESNKIALTVNPFSSKSQESKQVVDEKSGNQEAVNNDLSTAIEAETEEPIVITGKVIGSEKINKTNYIYFIAPILIVFGAGAYFIWKRLLKKKDYL